jgi:hypothetical protein
LTTKLKKKLSNLKPTKKPQGKCPNKKRKAGPTVDATQTLDCKEKEVEEEISSNTNSECFDSDEGNIR